MKLGLLLALVSALQMAQQSIISELSDYLSEKELAIVGAAFPAGKCVSTIFLALFPMNASKALFADACLLIIGSLISLIPWVVCLGIGRFFIGCGAGLGFVCATVVLYERVEYSKRPAQFCILGMAFALAIFLMNLLPLITLHFRTVIFIGSGVSGACGVIYLLYRPKDEESKEFEEEKNFTPRTSDSPTMIVYALMVLNVSIGVPIIIGFSLKIFENFGASTETAAFFSLTFPLVQVAVMLILYTIKLGLNRRVLIIGGYGLSLMIQFLLLITSSYPFLPEKHHTFFMCSLFLLMVIVASVPANTALCLISEQFVTQKERTKQISRGRAVMWLLSTVSTLTFMASLHKWNFTITFIPYFAVSLLTLLLVVRIYPKSERSNAVHSLS